MDWQISERQEKRMLDSGVMQLIMLIAVILPAIWIYCDAAKRYDTKVKTVAWLIAALLGWFFIWALYFIVRPPKRAGIR